MAWVFGPRFDVLARRGREFGLAFASAQFVHVGLVLWLYYSATGPASAMVFFWVGIVCTYLLALFSLPRLRDALGPRAWRLVLTIALEYIALAFAADFILGPLQASGLREFPLTYLPFALMLVGGAGLRLFSFWGQRSRSLREHQSFRIRGRLGTSQFGGMFRDDRRFLWLTLIFVGVTSISLTLDHALVGLFGAMLALYGPCIAVFVAYILLKSAVHSVSSLAVNSK